MVSALWRIEGSCDGGEVAAARLRAMQRCAAGQRSMKESAQIC